MTKHFSFWWANYLTRAQNNLVDRRLLSSFYSLFIWLHETRKLHNLIQFTCHLTLLALSRATVNMQHKLKTPWDLKPFDATWFHYRWNKKKEKTSRGKTKNWYQKEEKILCGDYTRDLMMTCSVMWKFNKSFVSCHL